MAVQKKFALGRGLDALISTNDEVKTSGSSSINEVELSKISVNPNHAASSIRLPCKSLPTQ